MEEKKSRSYRDLIVDSPFIAEFYCEKGVYRPIVNENPRKANIPVLNEDFIRAGNIIRRATGTCFYDANFDENPRYISRKGNSLSCSQNGLNEVFYIMGGIVALKRSNPSIFLIHETKKGLQDLSFRTGLPLPLTERVTGKELE